MRYTIRYTVTCIGLVLIYNDHKIKSGATSDDGNIASSPTQKSLEEMGNNQPTHLYETKEQGSYIATPFDNKPKFFGHRSSPPLYLIRVSGTTRNCVVTADFSR